MQLNVIKFVSVYISTENHVEIQCRYTQITPSCSNCG